MLIRKLVITAAILLSPTFSIAEEGGNSGGGGGDVPRNPVSTADIADALYQIVVPEGNVQVLNYFFINMKNDFEAIRAERRNAESKKLYAALFLGKKTIFQAINSLELSDIQFNDGTPCLYKMQPRDASVVDAITGKICISTYRLKDKIDRSRLDIELYAILAHELSHIAGVEDEALAQYIHKDLLTRQNFVRDISTFQLRMNSEGWMKSLEKMKNELLSNQKYSNSKEFYDEADFLDSFINESGQMTQSEQWNLRMTELDEKGSTLFGVLQEKVKLFAQYIFVNRSDVSKLVPKLNGQNSFIHDVRYGGATDNIEHNLRSIVFVPAKGDRKTMLLAVDNMIADVKAIQKQIDMYLVK